MRKIKARVGRLRTEAGVIEGGKVRRWEGSGIGNVECGMKRIEKARG